MPIIIPAILESSKEKFLAAVSLVTKIPGVERIQVDFGDGRFIPDKLLNVSEIDSLNPAFHWEAHLMCQGVKDFLDYQICGFKTIIIHQEAYLGELDLRDALAKIKQAGLNPAVCINPNTPVIAAANMESLTNQFQIMGVVPGKQGQSFIPDVLAKIKEMRALYPHAIIEVDGGVNETNIKSIKDAGADLIVAGSAIVKSENPVLAFEKLSSLITKYG